MTVAPTSRCHLISIAPELLAELTAIEQLITTESNDLGWHLQMAPISIERVQAIRSLISKARESA